MSDGVTVAMPKATSRLGRVESNPVVSLAVQRSVKAERWERDKSVRIFPRKPTVALPSQQRLAIAP